MRGEAEGACKGEGEDECDKSIPVSTDLPMGIEQMYRSCMCMLVLGQTCPLASHVCSLQFMSSGQDSRPSTGSQDMQYSFAPE